jgi:hypothetical protein
VTAPPSLERAVQLVLWLLAGYHLVVGAAALVAPALAARLIRSLYGATLPAEDAFRFATSMIGALALAIGLLAAVAALAPAEHRAIVGALIVLQLGRIFCRVRDRRLLASSLGVSPRSNGAAIAVLGAECIVLGLWMR